MVSLSIYLLIPIAGVIIYHADNSYRTAGTYISYENGFATSKMVLGKNNSVELYVLNDIAEKDMEIRNYPFVVRWTYKSSAWADTLDKKKYPHLSYEYLLLEGDHGQSYVTFFIIGRELYSAYLLDESRGGGQKCYQKV